MHPFFKQSTPTPYTIDTLCKEDEGVYELAEPGPYEEPLSTLKRGLGQSTMVRKASLMQDRPLPQISESTYEVPIDSLRNFEESNVFIDNPDDCAVYDLVPEPYAVPTVSSQPNTLEATDFKDCGNVYSLVDSNEQDNTIAEANIYEPLPI